jgi:hypothetical protein
MTDDVKEKTVLSEKEQMLKMILYRIVVVVVVVRQIVLVD